MSAFPLLLWFMTTFDFTTSISIRYFSVTRFWTYIY